MYIYIYNKYTYKEAVNCYYRALHLGCCSSPRSASALNSTSLKPKERLFFICLMYMLFHLSHVAEGAFFFS